MRSPDAALIRARAKAPLRDLQVLHLSSASIERIAHLELCRDAVRSLYADDNRLKDITGVLPLRKLWRIDLSGNELHASRHGGSNRSQRHVREQQLLAPLASFAALGFVSLERNQLDFADLVCLRDVHIMELRLRGNPALLQPSGDVTEYRMKVAALLPNVWILDGHYVSTVERERAVDECDAFVQRLLSEAMGSDDSRSSACVDKFGSTAELWGGVASVFDSPRASAREQHTNASRLIEFIDTQRVESAEVSDRRRLLTIAALYDDECAVHNAHCRFAPSKFAPNARAMPRMHLTELVALDREPRLQVAVTLAAHLEFGFARSLLAEALTIELLECASLSASAAEELAALPPFALAALLCVLRHHALSDQSHEVSLSPTASALTSSAERAFESAMWTSMPPLFTTLLGLDREARHSSERTDEAFASRCAFAVALLSRAASFPDDALLDARSKRRAAGDASSKGVAELLSLVAIAKAAIRQDARAHTSSGAGAATVVVRTPWVEMLSSTESASPRAARRMSWKAKAAPAREHPRPWESAAVDAGDALIANQQQTQQRSGKRKPRTGERLEIQPKLFLQIRHLSDDGAFAIASAPAASATSFVAPVEHLLRVSSRLWRLVENEASQRLVDAFVQSTAAQSASRKLGKLHRDSDAFHRHGAARRQGFPNHAVTPADVCEMERASERVEPSLQPQPVALFSSNDTLDANFVLAPPQLVSAQNHCAVRGFRERGQAPVGLWSPIKQAPFAVLAVSPTQAPSGVRSQSLQGAGTGLAVVKAPKCRETIARKDDAAPSPVATESSEWTLLQREMESVLRIKPRRNDSPPSSRATDDVLCFLTAVSSTAQDGGSAREPPSDERRVEAHEWISTEAAVADPCATRDTDAPAKSRVHTPPTIFSSASQSKLRGGTDVTTWHRVSTKPQLLVSSSSAPLLRPSAVPIVQVQSASAAVAAAASESPRSESAGRVHSASRAPLRLPHCHVVLPTLGLGQSKASR